MKNRTNIILCSKKAKCSSEIIKRLSLYLRNLKRLEKEGVETISSDKITQFLNASSVQFRKDLSYFGGFGKPGVGYKVKSLLKELENILGVNQEWDIALVGAGRLGGALSRFEGFSRFNLRIVCVFDNDKKVIGKKRGQLLIQDVKDLVKTVERKKIRIAIIATPMEAAQSVCHELTKAGVKGILNFSPLVLKVPNGVCVSNVDMACELESLIYFAKRKR
ncbi:MAG: redox-sensing transcriptional repressor Rex [Candidatus Omnitrophica bacterium]|nr:redox-sensing transcriptional repressor Rex [Candidatus Omnitrophota bacterium]MDD5429110.1 redox-sensing transcriptional repressor Rex [Candidatus Omnitrophota bacterium]